MDGFKRPARPRPPQKPTTRKEAQPQPQVKPVRPRVRPSSQPVTPKQLPPIQLPEAAPEQAPLAQKTRRVRTRVWLLVVGVVVLLMCVLAVGGYLLSPKDASASEVVPVEIVSGMLPSQIADRLEDSGVIRSSFAFSLYTRLNGSQNSLQAGNYQLSPADSTPAIAAQLNEGPMADEIEVMFTPGATLADNKQVLLELGYEASEIDEAFNAKYNHPLFEDRPAESDLEGYIYGETHRFVVGTPIAEILERYFDDYYAVIEDNDLKKGYEEQGLSLYEGITLASIIQREVRSEADQKQVAQVFFDRLSIGMSLGADATFEYAAKKMGVAPDPSLDSPYNTRKYTGLPPGPIASPGRSALVAAAYPAEGDYLYFVSGDDGVNHFSHTIEEHETKVRQYCTTLCFGQ